MLGESSDSEHRGILAFIADLGVVDDRGRSQLGLLLPRSRADEQRGGDRGDDQHRPADQRAEVVAVGEGVSAGVCDDLRELTRHGRPL